MQQFYQGSMRCKDFLPFLVNVFETHGWKIIDTSGDGKWAVAQKVATTGGIMTFLIRENNFPSFGTLCVFPTITKTDTVDENGVFVGGYDPTTKIAQMYYPPWGWSYPQSVVTDNSWPGLLQYYTAAKPDTDDTPVHLFYIISMDVDGFYIKTRGNPAVANSTQNVMYGGAFNKLVPEINTNTPQGLWGMWTGNNTWNFISMNINGTSLPAEHLGWSQYGGVTHFSIAHPEDADNLPMLSYDSGYPVSWLYVSDYNEPVISVPLPVVARGAGLVTENYFLEFNGDKYVYITEGNSGAEATLVKVMSGVRDLQVINNGSGHEIAWVNPNTHVLDKVKLYAKTTGMPTGHNDLDAVLIHTVDNAVANDIVTFVDSDPSRYGQTVYYAAFAFDSGEPNPNVSILSSRGSAKISPIIASLSSHVTKLNPSNVAYEFSNNNKINAFYSPVLAYPCNDNAASTVVTELINGHHATASHNTDTMTVAGQSGSALNLSGNKHIAIPASNLTQFESSYTFQGWFKKPATWGQYNTLIGGNEAWWRYDSTTNWNVRANWAEYNHPNKYEWNNDDFWFLTLVKRGNFAEIFMNGNRSPVGPVNLANLWSNNTPITIGKPAHNDWFFNGSVEDIEFYKYPLSSLQIKYCHNHGIFNPAFYNHSSIDGMAIISDVGATGEKAMLKLKGDEFFTNMTGMNALNVDCYSLRAGMIFSIVLVNDMGAEFVLPVTVAAAKTWETVLLDISAIQNLAKRNIKKIGIQINNADETNIVSIKNIVKA